MPEQSPKDSPLVARQAPAPEPGDYYMDGPYMVFTSAYHLRRGWCCESGCRHCPYGFSKGSAEPPLATKEAGKEKS